MQHCKNQTCLSGDSVMMIDDDEDGDNVENNFLISFVTWLIDDSVDRLMDWRAL